MHFLPSKSVEVGLTSSAYIFASASSPEDAVAVHGIEVELGRIDHEMVVKVVRREAFEEVPAAIECHLNLPPVAHAGPRFARWAASRTRLAVARVRKSSYSYSWSEIADRLGSTRQPAQMRYGDRTDRGAM